MLFKTNELGFLKSIFPPNYYIRSHTSLSKQELELISNILVKLNSTNQIHLAVKERKALIECINEFIRISGEDFDIVSGHPKEFFIKNK